MYMGKDAQTLPCHSRTCREATIGSHPQTGPVLGSSATACPHPAQSRRAGAGRGHERPADRPGAGGEYSQRRAGSPDFRRTGTPGSSGTQKIASASTNAKSTAPPKRNSLRWLAPSHPKAVRAGRCACWPTSWSSWRSSRPSATKLCAGRSKKRNQTLAEKAVVHRAASQRGVCVPDGGRAGSLWPGTG